jgi:hypothetical protein
MPGIAKGIVVVELRNCSLPEHRQKEKMKNLLELGSKDWTIFPELCWRRFSR